MHKSNQFSNESTDKLSFVGIIKSNGLVPYIRWTNKPVYKKRMTTIVVVSNCEAMKSNWIRGIDELTHGNKFILKWQLRNLCLSFKILLRYNDYCSKQFLGYTTCLGYTSFNMLSISQFTWYYFITFKTCIFLFWMKNNHGMSV